MTTHTKSEYITLQLLCLCEYNNEVPEEIWRKGESQDVDESVVLVTEVSHGLKISTSLHRLWRQALEHTELLKRSEIHA